MPEPYLRAIADHAKRAEGAIKRHSKIACLYLLTFPNGMIYIGCSTKDPLLRAHEHKVRITQGRRVNKNYRALAYALNKHCEVSVKTLAIGRLAYMLQMETAAIKNFNADCAGVGYNLRVAGRPKRVQKKFTVIETDFLKTPKTL